MHVECLAGQDELSSSHTYQENIPGHPTKHTCFVCKLNYILSECWSVPLDICKKNINKLKIAQSGLLNPCVVLRVKHDPPQFNSRENPVNYIFST